MASELLRWLSVLRLPSALVLKQCGCLAKKLAKVQNIVEFINDLVLSSDQGFKRVLRFFAKIFCLTVFIRFMLETIIHENYFKDL